MLVLQNIATVVESGVSLVHDVQQVLDRSGHVFTMCGRYVASWGLGSWDRADRRTRDGRPFDRSDTMPADGMCPTCVAVAEDSAHRIAPSKVASVNVTSRDDRPADLEFSVPATYTGTRFDLRGVVLVNRYGACDDCEGTERDTIPLHCVAARTPDGWALLHGVHRDHLRY